MADGGDVDEAVLIDGATFTMSTDDGLYRREEGPTVNLKVFIHIYIYIYVYIYSACMCVRWVVHIHGASFRFDLYICI